MGSAKDAEPSPLCEVPKSLLEQAKGEAMKIFEYAILLHPTKKAKEDGEPSKLIKPPTCVLACDQNAALVLAARAIPENLLDKLDRVEVAVRPF
jgi:hypothetical protein